jgi:hypothetical protein
MFLRPSNTLHADARHEEVLKILCFTFCRHVDFLRFFWLRRLREAMETQCVWLPCLTHSHLFVENLEKNEQGNKK